jgi:hypothetical protein
VAEQNARAELEIFDCQLPYVETPEVLPGEETVRLIKKPFKTEPKKGTGLAINATPGGGVASDRSNG